jgi:hypothetical protein
MAVLLAVAAVAHPASGQRKHDPPPPPDEEQVGTQTLPPQVCPSDFRDGPLYADGRTCYGIPALGIVEGFLAPPQDAGDPWKDVGPASLRVLADGTDYDACLRHHDHHGWRAERAGAAHVGVLHRGRLLLRFAVEAGAGAVELYHQLRPRDGVRQRVHPARRIRVMIIGQDRTRSSFS